MTDEKQDIKVPYDTWTPWLHDDEGVAMRFMETDPKNGPAEVRAQTAFMGCPDVDEAGTVPAAIEITASDWPALYKKIHDSNVFDQVEEQKLTYTRLNNASGVVSAIEEARGGKR